MGINIFSGKKVYLDSNIFIYALEGFSLYKALLTSFFEGVERGEFSIVTSELALAECLVKPCKDKNQDLIALYISVIQSRNILTVLPVSKDILIQSAQLRADIGGALPDAIHVASAVAEGCDIFLTNDKAIKKANALDFLILSDLYEL